MPRTMIGIYKIISPVAYNYPMRYYDYPRITDDKIDRQNHTAIKWPKQDLKLSQSNSRSQALKYYTILVSL